MTLLTVNDDKIPEYTAVVEVDDFLCDDFLYYAGYYNAAKILINCAVDNNPISNKYVTELNCDKNVLIFPIFYMYRHYIELQIKDLIRELDYFENKDLTKFKQHKLSDIFVDLKLRYADIIKHIPEKYGKRFGLIYYKNLLKRFDSFNQEMEYINTIDPTAINFRFSKDKKNPNQKVFPNKEPIEIDLILIESSIDKFAEFFKDLLFSIHYLNE